MEKNETIRILAVDDEEHVLKTIRETLARFHVTTERNAMNALEIVKQARFDIYIIDYQMPGLTGTELLEKIRELHNGDPYIGILCTGVGTVFLFKEEFKKEFFSLYVEKPFEFDNLAAKVDTAVYLLEKKQEKAASG